MILYLFIYFCEASREELLRYKALLNVLSWFGLKINIGKSTIIGLRVEDLLNSLAT